MSRSRNATTTTTKSLAKAARELERQIMTMEVSSGEDGEATPATPRDMQLPERLVFGPYGIAPLTGLHFDSEKDTATS